MEVVTKKYQQEITDLKGKISELDIKVKELDSKNS